MIDVQIGVVEKYDSYDTTATNTSLKTGDFVALNALREKTLAEVEEALAKVQAIPAYDGDTSLKDVVVAYIQGNADLLKNQEKELIELRTKWQKDIEKPISEEDIQTEKTLLKEVDTKNDELYLELDRVQEAFAKRHDYSIKTTEKTLDFATMTPMQYNDALINYQIKAVRGYKDYDLFSQKHSIATGDFAKVDEERQNLLYMIQQSRKDVAAFEGYKGDTTLRDVIVEYLDSLASTLDNEEGDLVNLRKKRQKNADQKISDSDTKKESELLDTIDRKRKDAYENLNKVQSEFAKKYDFTIN